jgi:hypothetical protein
MGQFNAQSINPLFQPDGISKNQATEKLKSFIKNLDSLSAQTHKNFKPELVSLLKDTSYALKAFIDSPQQNTPKLMLSSEKLLNFLAETNPEFLESNMDELNQIKKKNKKSSVTELLHLKKAILAGFTQIEATNQTNKIAPVKTDFSSKLKLFSRLNSESSTSDINSKKDVLESFGFTEEETSSALSENPNLFNALLSLLPQSTSSSASSTSQELQKLTRDITIADLNTSAKTPQENKTESKEMAIELITSLLIKNETNKLHDAFLNLESSTQTISDSTPKQIEEILAKDYNDLTLGDLNALEIYYTNQKQTNAASTKIQSNLIKADKFNSENLNGLIISLQNKNDNLEDIGSTTHPMLKLVASFSSEEIEALIKALLQGGISNLDDLSQILNLLGELGLAASPALLAEINNALQDFVDNLASTMSDPIQLMNIIATITQISQGELTEELNMDKIGAKMSQLIINTTTTDEAKQIINAAESLPIHINITPVLQDETTTDTPNTFSEQAAGALNQQTAQKKSTNETATSSTVNTSQHVSQITSIQKSSNSQKSSNQNESNEMKSAKITKKSSPQTLAETESLFGNLESIIEKTEPELVNSLLSLMSNIYKSSLNTSLDNALDSAFDKMSF